MHKATMIDPVRLCDAADSLLTAICSPQGMKAELSVLVGPHRKAGRLPAQLFTLEEYTEATLLLTRLGIVSRDAIRKARRASPKRDGGNAR